MITITCRICGGHDFQRDAGVYVCEGCGRKYAPHELLMPSFDPSSPKESERKVTEYLASAMAARQAGNYYESEAWCDRALLLESGNYHALRLRAMVVSMQVSPRDERTLEAIRCFAEALDAAPEEHRESLRSESKECISGAVFAHVVAQCAQYAAGEFTPGLNPVIKLPDFARDRADRLMEATGVDILSMEHRAKIAGVMNDSAVKLWLNPLLLEYIMDEHRDEKSMLAFVRGGDDVIAVIESAVNFAPNDDVGNLTRYRNMILTERQLIDAHSMRQEGHRWIKGLSLSDESKRLREEQIEQWFRLARQIDPNFEVTKKTSESSGARTDVSAEAAFGTSANANTAAGTMPDVSGVVGRSGMPVGKDGVGNKSIWKRTVDWKGLVALLCFARFLSMLGQPLTFETCSWLGLGAVFAMLWKRSNTWLR